MAHATEARLQLCYEEKSAQLDEMQGVVEEMRCAVERMSNQCITLHSLVFFKSSAYF